MIYNITVTLTMHVYKPIGYKRRIWIHIGTAVGSVDVAQAAWQSWVEVGEFVQFDGDWLPGIQKFFEW